VENYRYYLYRIKRFPINLYCGIKNIIRWTPVIWNDEDWDWEYLANILEYKFRRMSKIFAKAEWSYSSKRDARDTLICAELIKRLKADDDTGVNIYIHAARMISWNKMLGDIIGRRLQYWWD